MTGGKAMTVNPGRNAFNMKINVVDLGLMDYAECLVIQERLLDMRQKGEAGDTLLLVEHPPVLTLGRRGKRSNILASDEKLGEMGIKTYEVSRGGDVTYHGPGQIVGYPIMDLNGHGRDLRRFVGRIEEVFISLLAENYGIEAHSEDREYTGVWVGTKKITAIGIAVKRWVTMHGFAFNVNTDLSHFDLIVPCGLMDRGVTSVKELTGVEQDFKRVIRLVAGKFCEVFGMEENPCEIRSLIG
jgi:lipoyl(octanoyl) transferase